uniref:Uncharacterized protein n=1 Tax=Arundo donax TaxID=35708 RepID=A0A0A9D1S2_ARUDO
MMALLLDVRQMVDGELSNGIPLSQAMATMNVTRSIILLPTAFGSSRRGQCHVGMIRRNLLH